MKEPSSGVVVPLAISMLITAIASIGTCLAFARADKARAETARYRELHAATCTAVRVRIALVESARAAPELDQRALRQAVLEVQPYLRLCAPVPAAYHVALRAIDGPPSLMLEGLDAATQGLERAQRAGWPLPEEP